MSKIYDWAGFYFVVMVRDEGQSAKGVKLMTLLEDLEFRGLVHQVTNRVGLEEKMAEGPVSLYIGFDPSADSLHIGNLLPILCLRRFQLAGHRPIALVGGATGLIGDPSGRVNERSLNDHDTVLDWCDSIRRQLQRFIDFDDKDNSARLVNNYDWTESLDVITFLRDIGKHFSLNYMLAKDAVDSRLERGISFTEFSYMILQAHDFLNLHRDYGCLLQCGGSDQWGNITAGLELVRKVDGHEVFGLTMPLVTKSDGTKFGKSESGAIWLDRNKTTPYQFYQFWLNTGDTDVVSYIKFFTFLSHEEILRLEQTVQDNPGGREAQRVIAREITTLVHGAVDTERAERISKVLFRGNIRDLSKDEITEGFSDVPSFVRKAEESQLLVDILVEIGASSSKRQAREDISNGAISINGDKCTDVEKQIAGHDLIGKEVFVVRRGKKNYFLVKII